MKYKELFALHFSELHVVVIYMLVLCICASTHNLVNIMETDTVAITNLTEDDLVELDEKSAGEEYDKAIKSRGCQSSYHGGS